jgi:hypothetical protein
MANIKVTQQISGDLVSVKGTEGGIIGVAPYSMLYTAKGYGFQAMATSAVAALVVRPSTTAMATIRNNSANKNLIIEEVFAHNLVTTAAEGYANIWICSHPAGMAAITNDITVRNSMNGRSAGGSDTSFDNGATVADDGWFPWPDVAAQAEATGVLPGACTLARINGRIIVPPTGGISMTVVASVVGNTFCGGFRWYEVPITELANN